MKSLETTQLLPVPTWTDPRVHLLDDLWLLTIFAVLFAAGLPWLLSSFNIRIGAALLGLFGLAAIHIGFTILTVQAPGVDRGRRGALAALHAAGVIAVAFIWHYAGGVQNPAFLAVFVLPVIGAIFLSRWQPYVIAILAVVAVSAVALSESPELRWYVSSLGPGSWLTRLFGGLSAADEPLPAFYAPPGYYLVLLQGFAVLMLACAFAGDYLGTIFDRLHAHLAAARGDAERGQELWASLIEELPLPAALIDVRTLQVVAESAALATVACTDGAPAVGRKLTDAIHFSYPEILEELVGGADGMAPDVALHRGGQLRLSRVRVQHLAYKGRRLALILMEDVTEDFAVRAALDAAEQAILVLDAQDRVLAFNRPALALFSGTRIGADASTLLSQPNAPARWWDPGLTSRRKMHLKILPRVFQVSITAVGLPGEEERMYVIAFLPVARAEALDDPSPGAHRPSAMLPRAR